MNALFVVGWYDQYQPIGVIGLLLIAFLIVSGYVEEWLGGEKSEWTDDHDRRD